MAVNRGALLVPTDQFTVDVFSFGQHAQPVAGVAIASGDYSVADPAPAETKLLGVQSILVVPDVTLISGAGATVTVNVDMWVPGRTGVAGPQPGAFIQIASIALTAVGTYAIQANPWLTAATGAIGGFGAQTTAQQLQIPKWIRIRPVKSGTTTTLTYSVGLHTM